MQTGLRGADLVARALARCGVTRIFTLSGNHIMPIFDALLETEIEIVHVRHEAACVHMADAWSRLTGLPGVALVTGGQGQANGAAALFTARAAESPVVLLSGHAALGELGRGAFQELAQADLARPMTKASWTAQTAAGLTDDIFRAMNLACEGRPGPVHVALPVDLLEAILPAAQAPDVSPTPAAVRGPDRDLIASATSLIRDAARPMVLVGPALGHDAAQRFEARTQVPTACMESPRGINDPALGALSEILAQADLVVLIGKQLDFTLRFGDAPAIAPSCSFVVIDPEETILARARNGLGARLKTSGVADATPTLAALADAMQNLSVRSKDWCTSARAALDYRPAEWAQAKGTHGRLHPVELCHAVDAFFARHNGGTLICDGGEIGQWPQALVRAPRRLINGVSGTIGASIPFALAARLLLRAGPVVAMLGDGTFGFHMSEFETAVRYGLPFIAVVGNDARWNAEYQIQLRSYGADRAKGCDLMASRYDQVVAALGGFGTIVTRAEELPLALDAAYASGLPACINVMIDSVPAPVIRRGALAK